MQKVIFEGFSIGRYAYQTFYEYMQLNGASFVHMLDNHKEQNYHQIWALNGVTIYYCKISPTEKTTIRLFGETENISEIEKMILENEKKLK